MTYKTKLEEASKEYAANVKPENKGTYADFKAGSSWTLKYLSENGGEYRQWQIDCLDIRRQSIAGVDTNGPVQVVELEALLASEAKLELMNQNCISLGLHESRVRELEAALKVSEAKLKKAVEQRGAYRNGGWTPIAELDQELAAITIDSIKRGE